MTLAQAPETASLLGASRLSWIDADDQILSLHQGELLAQTERIELERDGVELRRTSADRLALLVGEARIDVPPPEAGAERRVHDLHRDVLISESRGRASSAHTRLFLVTAKGIHEGPVLGAVRAIDADADAVFAIADGRGGVALTRWSAAAPGPGRRPGPGSPTSSHATWP